MQFLTLQKLTNKLVEWTNEYVELYPPDKEKEHLYIWQPIYKQKLYAYFGILIYIGITIELCIKDYWKDLNTYNTKYIVKKYMRLG